MSTAKLSPRMTATFLDIVSEIAKTKELNRRFDRTGANSRTYYPVTRTVEALETRGLIRILPNTLGGPDARIELTEEGARLAYPVGKISPRPVDPDPEVTIKVPASLARELSSILAMHLENEACADDFNPAELPRHHEALDALRDRLESLIGNAALAPQCDAHGFRAQCPGCHRCNPARFLAA